MKIVSWNENGLAACLRKGFLRLLADAQPDIDFIKTRYFKRQMHSICLLKYLVARKLLRE